MPGLSETLANLARLRQAMPEMMSSAAPVAFGDNPGALRMTLVVPEGLPAGAPLVVALHGCGQTAAGYDLGTGWSVLGARFGFAVLLPAQQRANNHGGCFNWFLAGDIGRGMGEAASVRAMVAHAVAQHRLDPRRVFVTGLSAGGAMANVMLAAYPEVFAGGAIIAGLPYGAAQDVPSAMQLMQRGEARTDAQWGAAVRAAGAHRGAWPRVAVWHGTADPTVAPVNANDIVRQWLDVHGLARGQAVRDRLGTAERLRWRDGDGRVAVESVLVPGLGHAVPISANDPDPDRACGVARPFIVEAGLSSSYLIAQSWGIIGARRAGVDSAPVAAPARGIGQVIQKALQAAGLG